MSDSLLKLLEKIFSSGAADGVWKIANDIAGKMIGDIQTDDYLGNKGNSDMSTKFTYDDMLRCYREASVRFKNIACCYIEIFSIGQEQWFVRFTFCDSSKKPIVDPKSESKEYRRAIFTRGFDEEFSQFMNGNSRYYVPNDRDNKRNVNVNNEQVSFLRKIIDFIVNEPFVRHSTIVSPKEIKVNLIRSYKTLKDSSIILIDIKTLKLKVGTNLDLSNIVDTDCVIAEFNTKTNDIVKAEIVRPDGVLSAYVAENNGLLVID